mmetsp:Transcript_62803/g.141862  ORF Transcript_62803/g.141862 Transcript_62803/m.141862 type:complete len:839 (-) Transcript_62803:161-2677(-)|eukprot:CAMPEP_0197935370 /NCGR_PEP_ID=MMETSP1439-20131203/113217_1 /TAXON_ID=66791 /ORGANISM="Gonyaulax spinifera, Strain CCMP409" /LENGTH=838 /DNA_ID=CAMNT_0043558305 /DNA_START=83 /DNA_END=2599 /DNA_ORIENTATION=+
MPLSLAQIEDIATAKIALFKKYLAAEPPAENGESILALWDQIYDDQIKSIVVETVNGPSDDEKNPVFPYEKLQAIVGDGGNWKWPRMWQRFDELERRGVAYRDKEVLNFGQPSKNPNIMPQRILVVGGGPVGLRLAIELKLGGHKVTLFEKRREKRSTTGEMEVLGFTNRINRPHMWPFVRNDLARLNGKDFMSRQACYPVFTEPDTSSIGIDEIQVLLIKNALLLGVDIRLGAGYNDAKIHVDPKTMKPTWQVDCTYDEQAAKKFGMTAGKNTMVFDALIGCDGPRSAVRNTQAKFFGEISKRKFMDCIGIVANVRKVDRKRLKEMGFAYGQEPNDMNRTKMIFKDFFNKINDEAGADLESLIYYKASFHNYVILTPKRANLIENGMTEPVYHFEAAALRNAQAAGDKDEAKQKLKKYCLKVLKAAGIPVDDTKDNGGFVDAPNDCMAFDFAECWNTPKSIAFNLPPPDYDVATHGEWMGRNLVPFIGLAGDALLEPFWPMGLGLKRGWQAIMDTCYAVDNLYNRACFCERKKADPASWTWDNHFEALQEQISANFENCNRLKVGDELGKGEYKEDGVVMRQLKRLCKDAERPPFEVEIDPWTRYGPLEKEDGDSWKIKMKDEKWVHPKVQKLLAMKEFYDKVGGTKSGEMKYTGKKLLSVGGSTVGGGGSSPAAAAPAAAPAVEFTPPQRRPSQIIGMPLRSLSKQDIEGKAEDARQKLANAIMSSRIEDHVKALHTSGPPEAKITSRRMSHSSTGGLPGAIKMPGMDHMGHVPPPKCGDSVAEASEAMWNRMTAKGLGPAQEAELQHVRNMIEALSKSLESYKKAEQDILMKGSS